MTHQFLCAFHNVVDIQMTYCKQWDLMCSNLFIQIFQLEFVVDHQSRFFLQSRLTASWKMCMALNLKVFWTTKCTLSSLVVRGAWFRPWGNPTIRFTSASFTLDKLITQNFSHSHGLFLCACSIVIDIQMTDCKQWHLTRSNLFVWKFELECVVDHEFARHLA